MENNHVDRVTEMINSFRSEQLQYSVRGHQKTKGELKISGSSPNPVKGHVKQRPIHASIVAYAFYERSYFLLPTRLRDASTATAVREREIVACFVMSRV